MRKNISH